MLILAGAGPPLSWREHMNPSVFRAALRASAKVALGAAVAGCGGMVGSTAEHAAPEASAAVDAATPDAAQAQARTCDPPSFDCCVSMLRAVPPNDGGFAFPDAAVGNPEVQACCATVIARLDYDMRETIGDPDASTTAQQDEQTAAPVRWACCQVTPSEGPTCTPWGPPMPPEMPGEVA